MDANGREFVSVYFGCFAVKSPLKKPPGEGTGPTRHADLRGNLVGRAPPRGEPCVFQPAANPFQKGNCWDAPSPSPPKLSLRRGPPSPRPSPPGEGEAGHGSGVALDSCLWRRTGTLRVSAGWKPAPHDRQ